MRILITVGAAALLFAGQLASAEARGGRGGGLVHVRSYATPRGTVVPAHLRTSPDAILGNNLSYRPGTRPRYTALPGPEPVTRSIPVPPAEAPATAAVVAPAPIRKAAAAGPWCPPERLVGSGTGFCLIN